MSNPKPKSEIWEKYDSLSNFFCTLNKKLLLSYFFSRKNSLPLHPQKGSQLFMGELLQEAEWRFRLTVRTHASHAWNTSSILVGATKKYVNERMGFGF